MKKSLLLSIVIGFCILSFPIFSQNNQMSGQLGLPGDNLNLYGVLSIFQQSQTLEEFEQKLNSEDSQINNLDLNGDGKIDYIKVIDNVNGTAHAIVLRDYINDVESQDVAVIEVEKDRNNQIQIQIIGDMALYGKDYIIEPSYGTPNPGYTGNTTVTSDGHNVYEYNNYYTNSNVGYGANFVYTIGAWSIIHYMFAPNYIVYNSPYRWGYYPRYWHSWHPIYYNDYYGHWRNHQSYTYFHKTHYYHVPAAQSYYQPRRSASVVVTKRIEKGDYRGTYNKSNVEVKQHRNVRTQNNNNKNYNGQIRGANRTQSQINNNSKPTGSTINNTPNRTNNRSEIKQVPVQNNRPVNRVESRPKSTPNQNTRPANRTETRQTPVQNSRPAIKTETRQTPAQNSRPAEKKGERKDLKRK